MNKRLNIPFMLMWLLFAATSTPASAATYICLSNGKPVYTTERQGLQSCRLSQMDGITESPQTAFSPAPQVSAEVALPAASAPAADDTPANPNDDAITQIWQRYEYGSFDNTPILPPLPKPAPVAPNPVVPHSKKTTPPRPRHTLIAPPPPPKRRDILANEIARENQALAHAQRALQSAQKRQDSVAVRRLSDIVRDREANIRALQQEWKR
ncbi:hypothetical protein LNQ82_07500 [Conchiformibius steedae DSM 2580]|uniref:DUF4124 domain-containing protein n=1 Tax=Conchiformibius steedae DSM 2580 TaxID=1121352 RepID=A0AAE9HWG9_9NEIS|nr:hypothetical protein [Conchiformibius steedae]QMT34267.1 hypothetical protein H3L98_04590 [Conchiformibius steedae]URD67040.1 hypothetical protein LNQ82_07500 [Conchiformibius steedae DSM 2580]